MNYVDIFNQLYPDFFGEGKLSYMDEASVYEEMVMFLQENTFLTKDVKAFSKVAFSFGEKVDFGYFDWKNASEKERNSFLDSVKEVDETWPQWFGVEPIYCAKVNGEIASFCNVSTMGTATAVIETACGPKEKAFLVGGPGCVGTVPKFRRRGIGLKMVQDVTKILQTQGYDISYIHYTGVAPWYAKLGYESVVKWNKHGVL